MKTKRLVISAMMLAAATVLSVFQPFQLPFGGGITIASMMPLILLAYCYGTGWGLFSGFVFGVLQLLLGSKTVSAFFLPGDSQMLIWQGICVCLLDYLVAYTVVGFGGIFKGKLKKEATAVCLGSVVALLSRYIIHIVSGAVFFGSWAEWFFTQDGFYAIGATIMERCSGRLLALVYSIFYNGTYMIPEIIITAILTPIVYRALRAAKLTDMPHHTTRNN